MIEEGANAWGGMGFGGGAYWSNNENLVPYDEAIREGVTRILLVGPRRL